MEVPGGRSSKPYVFLYEVIGTGLLIIAVNWSAASGFQTWIVGLQLAVNIILLGPVSNSHCNPAVTLGVLIRESIEERSKGLGTANFLYALGIWAS